MLSIYGGPSRFCDGLSRRNFLKIGALGLGGLALPRLLQAEAALGVKSHKAIIMIYLPGGPPHQDMFDLKLDAPLEIRGEFKPIQTSIPGIHICEHLPRMARMMDKLIPIRSVVGAIDEHTDFQCLTGHTSRNQPPGGWPTFGSIVSKLQGPAHPAVPPFVGLEPRMQHRPYNAATPGFLGVGHRSFHPEGESKTDMALQGITLERLADRKALLQSFDRFRRDVDASGLMSGLDAFSEQAFAILTSIRLAEALDLSREDPKVVASYGKGDPKPHGDAAPMLMEQFLMARRLVEAGVRCVTVAFGFWDYHGNNHRNARADLPLLDQGVTALVEDLHARGLDKDVSVVVWGEFGRTPTINKDAGRDHWPRVSCALLACGGLKTGQVLGSTDRLGGEAVDRPVHFQEVFATLYHNLGIDVNKATVADLAGRPHYITDGYQPIRELI
ncbi:MAG: DUF1501 domain-containing protein [Verrucomicrobiota bacterium]